MTVLEETAFLLAVSWWCAFARASEPELRAQRPCDECRVNHPRSELVQHDAFGVRHVCSDCAHVLDDEQVFEDHAAELAAQCDCDVCYRHRVRRAQHEDDAELSGSRVWRPLDDDLTDISF